jgi:hypothetical protein
MGHIKFGGYDKDAILKGKELVDLDISLNDMSVSFTNFKVGDDLTAMDSTKVVFDPSYKGIHLPESDFKKLNTKLNSVFNRFIDRAEGETTCEPVEAYCYVEYSCGYVRKNA